MECVSPAECALQAERGLSGLKNFFRYIARSLIALQTTMD